MFSARRPRRVVRGLGRAFLYLSIYLSIRRFLSWCVCSEPPVVRCSSPRVSATPHGSGRRPWHVRLSLWFFRAFVHTFIGHEKKRRRSTTGNLFVSPPFLTNATILHSPKPIYVCTYFQPQPQASFSPASDLLTSSRIFPVC